MIKINIMKLKFIVVLFLFCSISMFSQSINISGTVIDQDDKMPLPGVNILVKNTSTGTMTDFNGAFTLNDIASGSVIVFSYLGYLTKEITVTSSDNFNIELTADVAQLDEVVIVGYGSQERKEITGAVAVVDADVIENLKPTRIEQALQGQVAGVNVTSQSGAPGSPLDIRIRGISTNGDNRPLILVDGNVIEDLSVINPGDIKSLTVLKDATAAIYGVRAANGVILITTKTGRKETPLQFNYDMYVGLQQTTRKIPVLNATEFALLANEGAAANGDPLVYPNVSGLGKGTDWQDEVFETAPIFNNNLTVSGGTKKSTYSFGSSLLTQDGIVGGDKANFTRYTNRINYGLEIIDDLNITANLIYTGTQRKTLPEGGLGSVLFNALNIDPTLTVRQEDGSFTRALNYPIEVINPIAQMESIFNKTKIDKISGVFGANYKFLNHFTATVNYQWNYSEVRNKGFFPIADFGNVGPSTVFDREVSEVVENETYYRDYTFDAFIDYDHTFNDEHDLKVTLGTSVFKTTADAYSLTGIDLEATTLGGAHVEDAVTQQDNFINRSHRIFDSRLLSYFVRIQYDFRDRYLFSAVVRRDGSTSFGPENKFGYFYSGSLGWVISDENFFSNVNFINFLKLRASAGVLGNDRIPGFRFVSLLNGEGTYVFDDELYFGTAIGAVSNPEIQWEEQYTYDIGLEATILNNRVRITTDYFNRTTENLLLPVESSVILGTDGPGGANPIANAGSVNNQGFEFQISYSNDIGKDFSFNISYNFATLNNEVTEVNNGIGFEQGGSFGIGQSNLPSRMQVGQPLGVFYGLQTNGVFQNQAEVDAHPSQLPLGALAQPGDIRFADINGDGVIDFEDRTFLGDPIPDVTMGLNLTCNFKNFDFQTYLFASLGNDIVRNYDRNDIRTNKTVYALDRWTGEGTNYVAPRITSGANSNFLFSDYFVEDGSFLRMQNIQLGYTINQDKIERVGLKNLRFYVSVNNAFTLTEYSGYDPTTSNGAPIGGGIDYGFYPNPRTFLFGTNVKF